MQHRRVKLLQNLLLMRKKDHQNIKIKLGLCHAYAGLVLQYEGYSPSALTIPLLRRNNALKREKQMHYVVKCVDYCVSS